MINTRKWEWPSRKNNKNLKSSFLSPVFRLIAGAINQNINIALFVYVQLHWFKRPFFHLKLPEGWMFSKVKISHIVNSSLDWNWKQSRPCTAMFVVSFANFNSCILSCTPSGDCVMSHAEVHFAARLLTRILLFWAALSSFQLTC